MVVAVDIRFDFKKAGAERVKALHGVNNGPVCYGTLIDVSDYFKEARIPHARLHDTNWPHPREVDINTIFPDFDRDPEDPASYDFRRTDDYIRSVLDTGAKVIYRLGVSIEHTAVKYYTAPPADYDKWARVCTGIIKHYNQGWADGHEWDIRHWEIWNEPDNPTRGCMWDGTPEQFYALYEAASVAIKRFDPQLKVGGFAATMVNHDFTRGFFAYCRERNLPLDFFSWHTYADHPEQVAANAGLVEEWLEVYGYSEAESHFNEWNYMNIDPSLDRGFFTRGAEYYRRDSFDRQKGVEGASFAAATLTLLQDCRVDVANYYDGQPSAMYCGLFDVYGVPQKTYYAFKAFSRLVELGRRVPAEPEGERTAGLYVCAAASEDGGEAAVLISNFAAKSREYRLDLSSLTGSGTYVCSRYTVDKDSDLRLQAEHTFGGAGDGTLAVYAERHSVVLLELRRS
nr:hypothetical protein [Cohnella hashimotonis]